MIEQPLSPASLTPLPKQVTLQSFCWSRRLVERGTLAEAQQLAARCQGRLREEPAVKVISLIITVALRCSITAIALVTEQLWGSR